MQDANETKTEPLEHSDSERDDSRSLIRLVRAYCAKHPESSLVFGIVTSGSSKMELTEMGDPRLRVKLASQLHVRAEAGVRQMERNRIVSPGEVNPEDAQAFMEQVRRGREMQGG